MPTLTPLLWQEAALAHALDSDTLVNQGRGQGKTTFLAMAAKQELHRNPDQLLVLVSPTLRSTNILARTILEILQGATLKHEPVRLTGSVEQMERALPGYMHDLVVLMDEAQHITPIFRQRLRDQLLAHASTSRVRVIQVADIPTIGPAVL